VHWTRGLLCTGLVDCGALDSWTAVHWIRGLNLAGFVDCSAVDSWTAVHWTRGLNWAGVLDWSKLTNVGELRKLKFPTISYRPFLV
jgi:hypothetical protein